ncbi:MAG: amidohydrolase/deacetylase family metallohydrolase [Bacillota bacterium]
MSQSTLLLKGGTVIDPASRVNGKMDVLVKDGKIANVAASIEAPEGAKVIDLTGKYVSAGWIDLHTHVTGDLMGNGVEPDAAGVTTGTTTVVDAGSVGAVNIKGFRRYVISSAKTRVVVYLNGAMSKSVLKGNYTDIRNVNLKAGLKAVEENADVVKGIKMLASITQVGDNGIEPIKIGRKLARLAGLPLMVHIGNPPPILEDVLNLMDQGDIITHAFHGKPGGILDRKGQPLPEAVAARKRGVWFDVGHGSESFAYSTFKKAMAAGFGPDSISTDLHIRNIKGPVFNMATTMSKFLAMGISLEKVIDLSSYMPAVIAGIPGGSLAVGSVADVTAFEVVEQEATLKDSEGAPMQVSRLLKPVLTVLDGEQVWSA